MPIRPGRRRWESKLLCSGVDSPTGELESPHVLQVSCLAFWRPSASYVINVELYLQVTVDSPTECTSHPQQRWASDMKWPDLSSSDARYPA